MIALLTLTWAGRTIRVAQRHVDIYSTELGRWLHYHAGLPALDLADALHLLDEGAAPTLQVDALLPVDVAATVESGHPLDGATAEVALYTGGTFEARDAVILGHVTDPTYRPGPGLVTITISMDAAADSALWPPADAVVDSDTWTSYDTAIEGRSYPWIIGSPGTFRKNGVVAGISGTPIYRVQAAARLFILAGHPCTGDFYRGGGWTAQITARDETTAQEDVGITAAAAWDWASGTDQLGRRIRALYLTAATAPLINALYADGNQLTARWIPGSSAGLGLDGSTDTPMERAGDVLSWALGLSSLTVDWRRTTAVAGSLRDYILAGYWDERCSPAQWVRDQLSPILPISLVSGPRGIYPVVWRWWAGRETARLHLEIGRSCAYVSGPTTPTDVRRLQEVSVRYARSAAEGMTHRATRTARADTPDRASVQQDLSARRAKIATVERPSEQIDADLLFDDVSAGLTARGRLQLWSAAVPTITIRVPSTLRVDLGEVLTLTWPQVQGYTRRPCLVVSRIRRGAVCDLTLRPTLGRIYR